MDFLFSFQFLEGINKINFLGKSEASFVVDRGMRMTFSFEYIVNNEKII